MAVAEAWRNFTPEVHPSKCLARTWADGRGGQCTRPPVRGTEYCKGHELESRRSHGRVDGPIPLEKLLRFRAASQRSGRDAVQVGQGGAAMSGAMKRVRGAGFRGPLADAVERRGGVVEGDAVAVGAIEQEE